MPEAESYSGTLHSLGKAPRPLRLSLSQSATHEPHMTVSAAALDGNTVHIKCNSGVTLQVTPDADPAPSDHGPAPAAPAPPAAAPPSGPPADAPPPGPSSAGATDPETGLPFVVISAAVPKHHDGCVRLGTAMLSALQVVTPGARCPPVRALVSGPQPRPPSGNGCMQRLRAVAEEGAPGK